MVRPLLLGLRGLLLLVVRDVGAVRLGILDLTVGIIRLESAGMVGLLGFFLGPLETRRLWFLLVVDAESRVVDALEEKVDVSEGFEMNDYF